MARRELLIEHLLRRIGFGASPGDIELYADLGYATALDRLINYESIFDGVDERIGTPGHVGPWPSSAYADCSETGPIPKK